VQSKDGQGAGCARCRAAWAVLAAARRLPATRSLVSLRSNLKHYNVLNLQEADAAHVEESDESCLFRYDGAVIRGIHHKIILQNENTYARGRRPTRRHPAAKHATEFFMDGDLRDFCT